MIKKYLEYIKESLYEDPDEDIGYEEEEDLDEFITDDEFRKFLIDNDCLYQYANNVHDRAIREGNTRFMDNFKVYGRGYINSGLIWDHTPEGNRFWAELNTKWMEIVNKEMMEKRRIKNEKREIERGKQIAEKKRLMELKKEQIKLQKIENKKKLQKIKKGEDKDFIIDDEFRQFLVDHKCYDEYIKNCYSRARAGFIEKLNEKNKKGWISNAFNWGVKMKYWDEINKDWMKFLNDRKEAERKEGKLKYDDFITDDEFRDFLIDNDCYDEYIENCKIKDNYYGGILKNFDITAKQNYINHAFAWSRTPEKSRYWEVIYNKWNKELKK